MALQPQNGPGAHQAARVNLNMAICLVERVFPLLPGKKPVTLRDQVLTGGAFDGRAVAAS